MSKLKKTLLSILGIGVCLAAGKAILPDHSFENLPNVAKEAGLYRIISDEWTEVEIPDQDMPEATLRKWGDETFIKVSYPDFSPVSPKQNEGKLKWQNGNKEVHLYPTKVGEIDAFEFEIVLKEKPTTNKIVLDLELGNVKAYYQPPLTEEYQSGWSEEFQREIIVTETDVKDLDGNTLVHRPENVVGSYVFYHATKGNIHPVGEAEKYKTSQIGLLHRPKIFDAIGNWAWSKQEVKNGQQIITISQDFLDNAVYPIRHAGGDTFGFEDQGVSSTFFSDGHIEGSFFTGAAGTALSITAYAKSPSVGFRDVRPVIYRKSDGARIGFGAENDHAGAGWKTSTITSGGTLTAVDYWLTLWSGDTNETYYNSETGKGIDYSESYHSTNDPPASVGASPTLQNRKFSIYCTYTPSAPPAEVVGDIQIKSDVQIKSDTQFK